MTCALGIAFRSRGAEPVIVGVVERAGAADAAPGARGRRRLHRPDRSTEAEVERAVRDGRAPVVVVPGAPPEYRFDAGPRREPGGAARGGRRAAARRRPARTRSAPRSGRSTRVGSRYIDWLVPGLLGMNIMSTGLWGVGFSIVQARTRKLLKRLVATPMSRAEYLASHVLSRLLFLTLETVVIVGFAWLAFEVRVRGGVAGARAAGGAGRAQLRRPRAAGGEPRPHDRSGVGADEPGDDADVGAVGRVLLVEQLSRRRCSPSSGRCRSPRSTTRCVG